ncbi:ATP-binding cassette sub-family A member 13-like [Mixophyes fleayi]|uniref:ATP-binding cassette sub-family A member 13-like n=1 Tax=Mixophyes fleayi TaxID=3061075 RepID=UPI003F4DC661
MGLFIHQFGILFWKNWLCRIRQPTLCFSEMIWPCALFFILAAIRLQEPPMHIDNCYLEPRNLPSHGIYPFIQSLLCNAGSSCKDKTFPFETNNTSWSFEDDLQEIDISLLKEIQELSQDILETTEKESSLYKLWEEMFNFNHVVM